MGFFSNLFKQMMKSGNVLGGDYFGYSVTLRTFEDKSRGMGLNVAGKDEVKITKADVKEFTIIEPHATFNIVANDCSQFESTFML